jgi:tetratricopeptide (TPR) repeat protein
MVLAATVGLVLYMNFADGTMQGKLGSDSAHLEVRDRDYFWQAGFILFGLSIGIGFAALWNLLHSVVRDAGASGRVSLILLPGLALPAFALAGNYHEMDRSDNYVPYDYAYNILMSADPNAVMFTNGDNDTFPVWCLQEVYGVRPDVRIANLSLLNTDWYIKQLKNEMGVPISYTDEQIEALRPVRTQDGQVFRVQDLMIDNIIQNAYDPKGDSLLMPINFSVTVSESNRIYRGSNIDEHLEMHGMAYRLKQEKGRDMIDVEATRRLYLDVFKFRGVGDADIYKDENAARLTNNYGSRFMYSAELLRHNGDTLGALQLANKAVEVLPHQWQNYAYLAQTYVDIDSFQRARDVLRSAPDSIDMSRAWASLASSYWNSGRKEEAYAVLNEVLGEDLDARSAYQQLLGYYYRDNMYDSLRQLLQRWVDAHPADSEARMVLEEAEEMFFGDTAGSGVRVRQVDTVKGEGQTEPSDSN